jgi:RNA polymerase sigma factor (sigma-70 family)
MHGSIHEICLTRVVPCTSKENGPCWADLVEKIRVGDNSAVVLLYSALADGPCVGVFRRLDPQYAEDRLHEVMVIVIEAIRSGDLRDPDRLMGFVWAVVRRRAMAYIRVAALQRQRSAGATQQELRTPREESPEERTSARERRDGVRKMLGCLKARDREILDRFYYREESPQQICSDMHLTATQFRLFKWRALVRCGEIARRAPRTFQSARVH